MTVTLTTIREVLAHRRQASISELALHFDAAPDAIRGALDIWIAKGRARRLPMTESCTGCSCGCQGGEIFEWTG